MSVGPGGHSTETLDTGLECLKRQQVKMEQSSEKDAMERELKDCNSTCWVCWTFHTPSTQSIVHFTHSVNCKLSISWVHLIKSYNMQTGIPTVFLKGYVFFGYIGSA